MSTVENIRRGPLVGVGESSPNETHSCDAGQAICLGTSDAESQSKADGSASAWEDYEHWNTVLAEIMFPLQEVPAPVYLDLEDDQIRRLGNRLGIAEKEVVPRLTRVVIGTAELRTAHAFRMHAPRILRWRVTPTLAPPPVLPLLAVFSLAAERMTQGEGMSATNYYGRLAELLGTDATRIGQSYRQLAEPLWGCLNYWLTELDGEHGLPTAYSVGLRYVGLALSQALVRAADRQRLIEFFSRFDLDPGTEIAPPELESLLDFWITSQTPSPAGANLARLWARSNLRARIAEIAAVELLNWNGLVTGLAGKHITRVGIGLALEISTFPLRRLRVFPAIPASGIAASMRGRLICDDGFTDVSLEPLDERYFTFADISLLSSSELLEGVLALEDNATGDRLTRQPRRLAIFRKDHLSGRWLESRQVLLGDTVLCLVMKDSADEVATLLAEVARPGWEPLGEFPGLPDGWVLIRNIEIISRPANQLGDMSDLRPLVPLTTSQLRFSGGFPLPGRVRNRWHSNHAPEISAINDSDKPFHLRLVDLGPSNDFSGGESLLDEWTDNGGSLIVDLATLGLEDGEYAIEYGEADTESASARREFSLRSSLSSNATRALQTSFIAHDASDPLSVLDADNGTNLSTRVPSICGVVTSNGRQPEHIQISSLPGHPWWATRGEEQSQHALRLVRPLAGSCFFTGTHKQMIDRVELDGRGKPIGSTSNGRCIYCGTTWVYSTDHRKNRRQFERRKSTESVTHAVQLRSEPRERSRNESGKWETALDCLHFLGGGPYKLLESTARQIDDSSLFVAQFTNALEALGRLEVRRSPQTLKAETWQICQPAIVDTGPVRVLAGSWSADLAKRFSEYCHGRLLEVTFEELNLGFSRTLTSATFEQLAGFVSAEGVKLIANAGRNLAGVLPPLSHVLAVLPRKSIEGVSALAFQYFDPAQAMWVDTSLTDEVGAYRTKGFARHYYLRTQRDLESGAIAVGTHGLAKHAASIMLAKRVLAAYDPRSREFIAPLGANLPGMYERALTIETQRIGFPRRGYLIYPDVPPELAARVAYLLEN